jgi:hypothetical protein
VGLEMRGEIVFGFDNIVEGLYCVDVFETAVVDGTIVTG